MSSRGWNILGVVMIVLAIFVGLGSVTSGNSLTDVLAKHGTETPAGSRTYTCESDPTQVAMDIAQDKRPDAQATDEATNTRYLRYGKDVVSVSGQGPTGCQIKIEPRERVGGGGFIFLGPGFFPGSPSRSSGGTSGGGGVK